MALTKVRRGGTDTGISDSSDATAITIDSSERVGIGTNSPVRALEISGNNNDSAKSNYIRLTDTDTTASATTSGGIGGIEFFSNDSSAGAGISASIEAEYAGGGGGGEITFNTNATSGGTLTERARINESGQVQVNGNQTLLDSDTFFQVNVNGGNGDNAFMAIACNGSNTANQEAGIYLGRTNNRIMTTVDGSANFRDDIQIRAGGSGGVSLSSGGTSFTGASDEKLKTIIENITDALDNVAKLRTVIGRYEWDAEDKRRSFLIAQDVQAVLPEVVEKNPEGNLMLDYTGVIPLLTAALKEAKTKMEALEARVKKLEDG